MSKYGVFSGPYLPVFRLNTKIFGVNLRIHSEYKEDTDQKKLCIWTLFTQCTTFRIGLFATTLLKFFQPLAIALKSFNSDIAGFMNKPLIIYFSYSYSGFFLFTMPKRYYLEINCVFINWFIFDGFSDSGYWGDLYRILIFHFIILPFIAMLKMVNKIKIYSWSYLLWNSWAWRKKK